MSSTLLEGFIVGKQALPTSGPARERLRVRGQFWTPDWVADTMIGYVLAGGASEVFDPAVGPGAFFAAARREAAIALRRRYRSKQELFIAGIAREVAHAPAARAGGDLPHRRGGAC